MPILFLNVYIFEEYLFLLVVLDSISNRRPCARTIKTPFVNQCMDHLVGAMSHAFCSWKQSRWNAPTPFRWRHKSARFGRDPTRPKEKVRWQIAKIRPRGKSVRHSSGLLPSCGNRWQVFRSMCVNYHGWKLGHFLSLPWMVYDVPWAPTIYTGLDTPLRYVVPTARSRSQMR